MNEGKNLPGARRHVEPVAIVGAACRLPGAADLEGFWSLLASGGDAVGQLPPDRFNQAAFLHPRKGEPGRSYSFAAAHLGDITRFDAPAFGLSPREAVEMDPQQRLLLEVAAEALEDAGWPASQIAGRNVGVYIGGSSTDHAELRLADPAGTDRYFMTGNTLSILANRLTNVFDLRGPGQTIDTACSSSLVALHAAMAALRSGQIEAAVVGGVQMLLSPFAFAGFSRAGMLSLRGRCQAFDAAADGYVRGEGAGVILLKPLSAALADGDAIRGVVLATGTNAVGRTIGLSLPNREAQAALLKRVLQEAGVSPDQLAYFEAHGTGTQAGDPAESWAIGTSLAQAREMPLPMGSAKTNIGHLEPASGMAGLLKAMLVLERGQVPPNLHFSTPNPNIDFTGLNLRVPTTLEDLPHRADAVVGVNSFGFGGTNATLLMGMAPAPAKMEPEEPARQPPLLLSARSAAALKSLVGAWQQKLADPVAPLPALLRGAARHRDLHPHRLALRGTDAAGLGASLEAWRAGEKAPGVTQGVAARGAEGHVAFVFSGNGSQFAGMAQDAMALNPAFRAAVEAADAVLAPLTGWSGAQKLAEGVSAEDLAGTDHAQPLLFLVQYGIVAALAAEGIHADMILGHSVGEVAAALAAGILTLEQAARLVVARSRAQHRTRGHGRMAAIGASAEAAAPLLAACAPDADGWSPEIAAYNGPDAITVAGPAEAIGPLVEAAKAQRLAAVQLDLDYAFHSAAMDPVRSLLAGDLAGLRPAPGRLPFISSVSGAPLPGEALNAEYWWQNLRAPVRFSAAVQAAADSGARLFIEIGPHAVLQSYLRESLRVAEAEAPVLPSLTRRDPPGDPFPGLADRAFALGADPRQGPAWTGAALRRGLPPTPYERQRHWFTPSQESARLTDPLHDHPLLGLRHGTEADRWSRLLDTAQEPWLADHKLGGEPVLPAAAMLDMALAAAALRFPDAPALELRDMQILRALPLSAETTREMRCTLETDSAIFAVESRPRLAGEGWTLHLRGQIAPGSLAALSDAPLGSAHDGLTVSGEAMLQTARRFHLDYGPAFQVVQQVRLSEDGRSALVSLALPQAAPPDAGWLLHPVRLDGALQGLVELLSPGEAEDGRAVVPVRFGRLVLRRNAPVPVQAELLILHRGDRSGHCTLALRDGSGQVVARLEDCWMQRVRMVPRRASEDAVFRIDLVPAAGTPGPAPQPDLPAIAAAAAEADAAQDLTETALLLEGHVLVHAHAALLARADAQGRLPAGLGPYTRSLLQALAEGGLAEPPGADGVWRLLPGTDLPDAADIWQAVLNESPMLAHELAWLALAAERLPATLQAEWLPAALSTESPAAERARDGTDPRMAAFEADAALGATIAAGEAAPPPPEAAGFERLATVLARAVTALAADWPMERPLRVLEAGANGGPLTRALLAALGASGRRIRYIATGALGDARAAAIPPHADNIEFGFEAWDPAGSAVLSVTADLVVGLATAARTRHGLGLLPALGTALAEGGTLLLAEPLPGRAWDFACGQDAAWWETGATPLPAQADWLAALAEPAGWAGARLQPLSAAPWPALLIAARHAAAPVIVEAPATTQRFLLLADGANAALAEALSTVLTAAGATLAREKLEDGAKLPPRLLAGASLLLLAAPDAAALPATLAGITALAESARGRAKGFTLVTRDTRLVPEAAACLGLARVLANEMSELMPRRISLAADLPPQAAATRLLPELLGEDVEPEPELHLSATARLVPRLMPGAAPSGPPAGPARLAIRQPGQLGSLAWEPLTLPAPAEGEVVVRVEAAGLNFRDLMWAQGLLPEEALLDGFAGPTLGMEMAGIVEQAGPGSGLVAGDRVFGFAPAALASRVRTRAEAIARLPEGLDFAAAATVPVAFLTAIYALERCAHIRAGETVLIHGGAGAVGLAALQVARAAGARVAATAGSAAKRAFLRAAGAELVLDSRDAGFADHLRAAWPEGVDIVLNSLAGDAMERSLGLVKPFGRFIELGKRDFFENRRVGMRPYRQNLTYYGVDVDQLPKARPALAQELLTEIGTRLAAGALHPLPHARLAAQQVETAFRTLQASGHIGKLVLTPPPLAEAAPAPAGTGRKAVAQPGTADAAPWAPPAGTILVVGGTQGFGFECAKWLAAHGATHLALLSRRGGTAPGAEATLRALNALGASASIHAADATDAAALAGALAAIRADGPDLVGVVHAAASFDDGAATALDAARFAGVLAPKLAVAENLDRLTRRDRISLFLLFSSATTAMGNPGQANYVAANMALEALARRRQSQGLPALAVGWGPIADAGVLAGNAATAETLARRLGVESMAAAEALSTLPALLASGTPVLGLARIGWREARMVLPILEEPIFSLVRGRKEKSIESGDLRAHLLALPVEEARSLLRQAVQEEVARILRLPPEAVPADAPVAGLGLDSLGGLELRGALEQRLGMQVPLASVTEDLTIEVLARRLAEGLSGSRPDESIANLVEQFEPSGDGPPLTAEAAE